MTSRTLQVLIDDRARLMSAVLAATDWPDGEQARQRHRAHVHARRTAKRVAAQADHPAVRTLQTLLDQRTPLEAIYTYALNLSWPDLTAKAAPLWVPLHWNEQLGDFYLQTGLEAWWTEELDVWRRAFEQTQKITASVDFHRFFEAFVGEVAEQFILMPTISYPSDCEIGVRLVGQLFCIIPPRIAWGDNEPWPFDEDEAHIYRGALSEYGRLLLVSYLRQKAEEIAPATRTTLPVGKAFTDRHPTWGDQFTGLFVAGAVAIFLEQTIGPQEAQAYILMEHRVHGLTILPGVVSVLKRYLKEREEGRYEELSDYLPNFAKHLRVANRVVSL